MMKQTMMLLMMAACLTGCSSDDEPKGTEPKGEAPRPMYVDVEEKPAAPDAAAAPAAISRGPVPTTTATLSQFKMNYSTNQYELKKTGTEWSTTTWPNVTDDTKIDFYAYTAGTFNYNDGHPYLAFTVESTVSNQHDLLVAERKQISRDDDGGHVNLTFYHACAIVVFNVQITDKLIEERLSGNDHLTVNSITLKNVNKQGDYQYDTKTWTNVGGTADYALTTSAITVTTTPQRLLGDSGYVYLIPQQREANGTEGTYLEIQYDLGTGNQTATIPLSFDWKGGMLYTINILLGTAVI